MSEAVRVEEKHHLYAETSIVHAGDLIRHRKADFAVLDRGESHFKPQNDGSFGDYIDHVRSLWKKYPLLLFPVPKYGFGAEILRWLHRNFPGVPCYVDNHLMVELEQTEDRFWFKSPPGRMTETADRITGEETKGFLFVSDPHLSDETSHKLVDYVLGLNGLVMLSSSEPAHSYSGVLLERGDASQFSYPVHFDEKHYKIILNSNDFAKTIPYHMDGLKTEKIYVF